MPCARSLTPEEVNAGYEHNTGVVIVETFKTRNINPVHVPGVICRNHGPFAWGKDALAAAENALILEEVAKTAALTLALSPSVQPIDSALLDRHYFRKHGARATYGQKREG